MGPRLLPTAVPEPRLKRSASADDRRGLLSGTRAPHLSVRLLKRGVAITFVIALAGCDHQTAPELAQAASSVSPKRIGWKTVNGQPVDARMREQTEIICEAKSSPILHNEKLFLGCMATSGYLPIYEAQR